MPSTAATGGPSDIPCLSFTQRSFPFSLHASDSNQYKLAWISNIHLITNQSGAGAISSRRRMPESDPEKRRQQECLRLRPGAEGRETNLVSPFMRSRSFMGPHTHADDGRRDLVRGQQPAASVRHSGVHTTFATAVTSAAFQGRRRRRRRRRSIALPRPPSKLRESPSSPFSPSSFTLLCEEVTKERREGGRDACNDDGAREDA